MIKIKEFKLTLLLNILLNIGGLIIVFGGYGFIRDYIYNVNIFVLLIGILLMIVLHELFHGIFYKIFGAKIKVGIKLPFYAYIEDTSGNFYTVMQMILILIAPCLFLSLLLYYLILLFPVLVGYLSLFILFNISGAIGDIVMIIYLLLQNKKYLVKDEKTGFSLWENSKTLDKSENV